MSKIFIPKTCRVGFQERDDTFTKKLAYVIYYDARGTLRKEKSWEEWRHKPGGGKGYRGKGDPVTVDVAPYDFENEPTSGFVLNKGHTRYSWSHFGERRTVIRIYDPRGVEFEISPENLVALLMHTDCNHREIQGELVYAWKGTELMLLPCSSEEYQSARDYTDLQGTRVGAKDLKEGFTYITKNQEPLIYLGRHMWYEIKNRYDDEKAARVGKKTHIFYDPNWNASDKSWEKKPKFKPVRSIPNTISKQVSDGCHDDYANLVDEYLKTPESAAIVKWETKPLKAEDWEKEWRDDCHRGPVINAATEENGHFVTVTIGRHREKGRWDWRTNKNVTEYKGPPRLSFSRGEIVRKDGSTRYCSGGFYYPGDSDSIVTDKSRFFLLYAVYENGLKRKWSHE
jgi:hypothetical protein